MQSSTIKNILFITSTRLGDAVISTGILNELISNYPEAQFTIACGSVAEGLFTKMPRLKRILVMEKQKYDLHWFLLWKQCVLQSWDLVVDLRGSAISYILWTKKRIIVRGGRVKERRVDYLAKTLSFKSTPLPVMWMDKNDIKQAQQYLPMNNFYIALAPTANWSGKVWDSKRFIQLATRLKLVFPNVKFPVFYGGGEQEYKMAYPLLVSDLPIIDVGGKFNLVQVASLLSCCQGFVGNDSGLMHLAAACQIPVLGLFGPSKVSEYAPAGLYTASVVAKGEEGKASMENLSVEDVFQSLMKLLNQYKVVIA